MKNYTDESKLENAKTFIVRYGTATAGRNFNEQRENFHLGLVDAPNLEAARDFALKVHCPEAAEFDAQGSDSDDICDDFDALPDGWTSYNGHDAFELGDKHSEVDRGCVFWIESAVEVPEADAVVLRKYLNTDADNTCEKDSLPEPATPSVPPPSRPKTTVL